MADLDNLQELTGDDLPDEQIRGILAQIDLNVANLLRDGKLAALKYGGAGTPGIDRATNLKALLEARRHYERLLSGRGTWTVTQADCDCEVD